MYINDNVTSYQSFSHRAGDPGLKPFYGRLKLWWQNEKSVCSGEWWRYICNIGPAELHNVTKAEHLFVNKVHRQVSPIAYECLTQWHDNRTQAQATGSEQSGLNIEFYRHFKFVNSHV